MKLCDEVAGIAAIRHCGQRVVTVGFDRMTFQRPVLVGELVTVRATVNAAWRSSMEVGVRVEKENVRTREIEHTSTAYITMVALDDDGRPAEVPAIDPETDDEQPPRPRGPGAPRQPAGRARAAGRGALVVQVRRQERPVGLARAGPTRSPPGATAGRAGAARLAASMRSTSSAVSSSEAAARLSASCSSVRAPTISEVTAGRVSSQASVTWAAETPWRLADLDQHVDQVVERVGVVDRRLVPVAHVA